MCIEVWLVTKAFGAITANIRKMSKMRLLDVKVKFTLFIKCSFAIGIGTREFSNTSFVYF